jgi:hypothetical protein
MQAEDPGQQTITLEGEDGRSYDCRLLGVFEFDNRDYALLLRIGDDEDESDSQGTATVIMRFSENDGQAIFRTIEREDEFDRVVAYVKGLAANTPG